MVRDPSVTSHSDGFTRKRLYVGIGTYPCSMPVGGVSKRFESIEILSAGKLLAPCGGENHGVFHVPCAACNRSILCCM